MFGRRWNRRDEKNKKKKKGGKMGKSVVWYIRERESNFSGGSRYFLRKLTQNLSFQNGKKTGWSEFDGEMTKLRMCNAHGQSPVGFFFFLFFSSFLGMNVASLLLFFHFDILSVGVVLFCFNYISFCNNDIWVNLYKFIFFIFSLFHCQPNKNKEN